jgi:uncharacterized protein YndB with AHSA1/START domain
MSHYVKEMHFNSPPEKVYEAITTEKGIKSWWTVDCDINPEVGGVHTFRFERLVFNSMKVTRLEKDRSVHWSCVEGWNEWLGTEVVFLLEQNAAGGTDMVFEHIGLTPDKKCYKMCASGWDKTLESLKSYVDSGAGSPHVPKKGLSGIAARTAFKLFSRQYTK